MVVREGNWCEEGGLQRRNLPSGVQTGTLLMPLVTISWMTSSTVVSMLQRHRFSYVPIFSTLRDFRNRSVSVTLIAINFRIRYCVMTLVT